MGTKRRGQVWKTSEISDFTYPWSMSSLQNKMPIPHNSREGDSAPACPPPHLLLCSGLLHPNHSLPSLPWKPQAPFHIWASALAIPPAWNAFPMEDACSYFRSNITLPCPSLPCLVAHSSSLYSCTLASCFLVSFSTLVLFQNILDSIFAFLLIVYLAPDHLQWNVISWS